MRVGNRVDRKKKGLTKTRDGWRNHRKTVWVGKVGDRHGGCDEQDKSRLQAVGQEARWNVFEQMVLKEPQSCRNGLSHHREEDLEARTDRERVELVSTELLCSEKEHSSKHLLLRLHGRFYCISKGREVASLKKT